MNLWFWDDVLTEWRSICPDTTLSGIGTLIGKSMISRYPKILVCGSGAGYGNIGSVSLDHVKFSWVRGPHTASLLGLSMDTAITDPACLVAYLPRFAERGKNRKGAIFVPHRLTANLDLDWGKIGDRAGLEVVLPTEDSVSVIKQIRDAELVIAESMHGAIIADAFRVPWVPVAISHHFNTFKWRDWSDSVEVKLELNEALHLPRNAYFLLRNPIRNLKALLGGEGKRRGASGSSRGKIPFENPNYMEKNERDTIKSVATRMAPIVERLLVRDLRRLTRRRPHMSHDGVLADRNERMLARLEKIRMA
jgi:succinoglycan biosynthesis protein ExoV